MEILIAFFSGTGNTANVAEVIKDTLMVQGAKVTSLDITPVPNRRLGLDISRYQAFFLGAPVYYSRAPQPVRDWLQTLTGKGMPCATFFTYGGFLVHPVHFSTREILEKQGFDLVSSAEFLGAHTYNRAGWESMMGRPNESDFDVAREFVARTWERLIGKDKGRPGPFDRSDRTYADLDKDEAKVREFVDTFPTRSVRECSLCMICQEACPTGAMDAETGQSDSSKCITCLRCLADCPEEVLEFADMRKLFLIKMQMDGETADSLAAKKSRTYF